MANLIGWIMSVEIERRERALFWSARQLSEATRALETMAHKAAEADVAKTRVLAAVSHDLRQPLASLSLYAQLLRSCDISRGRSGLDATVERMEACVGALSGNLDRLSELGGLRDGFGALAVEAVCLRSVLARIESVYSAEAARRGIRLVVRVPEPGHDPVSTNENRLWDVLSNLVGNALKFASPDRPAWVLVKARQAREYSSIVVCDNGIGIDMHSQRHVFDEYFQVANHARNVEHGYGLGLSIVRETVSRLPGHAITLVSRPGHGARFTVSIPAAAPRERPAITAARQRAATPPLAYRPRGGAAPTRAGMTRCESPPTVDYDAGFERPPADCLRPPMSGGAATDVAVQALAGAYVLVIEDDASMRDALGRMLQQWGVLVEAAASGEDALRIVDEAERSFDAIVSDYRLPGEWDGIRLIDELRRVEGVRLPAILLSGEYRVESLRVDAPDDVFVMGKPPDLPLLHSLLVGFMNGVDAARA